MVFLLVHRATPFIGSLFILRAGERNLYFVTVLVVDFYNSIKIFICI